MDGEIRWKNPIESERNKNGGVARVWKPVYGTINIRETKYLGAREDGEGSGETSGGGGGGGRRDSILKREGFALNHVGG